MMIRSALELPINASFMHTVRCQACRNALADFSSWLVDCKTLFSSGRLMLKQTESVSRVHEGERRCPQADWLTDSTEWAFNHLL